MVTKPGMAVSITGLLIRHPGLAPTVTFLLAPDCAPQPTAEAASSADASHAVACRAKRPPPGSRRAGRPGGLSISIRRFEVVSVVAGTRPEGRVVTVAERSP